MIRPAFAVMALAGAAAAQPINFGAVPAEQTHVVQVSGGLENAFVASVGYGRGLSLAGRALVLTGDFTLPWAAPDLRDFEARVGVIAPVVESAEWKLSVELRPLVRGTSNQIARMTDLGLQSGLVLGYYTTRWFGGCELGLDWAAATYIESSARYRELDYAGAKDGWYASTGASLRGGLFGGHSFGRVEVVASAGEWRDLHLRPSTVPFFAAIGVSLRLPR
ncbi:MAG TPA: hypothetical protein VLW85_21855 [Myxococcales bacterium]|nr:hypothetical protein [Myxococcales bacterium]